MKRNSAAKVELLPKEEQEQALQSLQSFFEYYPPATAKEQLWNLLVLALSSDCMNYSSVKRANLIFFYERLVEMIESGYELALE